MIWGDDYHESSNPDPLHTPKYDNYGINYGDDTIYGGAGADIIYGGSGHDHIHGGEGQDYLYAHGGEDTTWGGAGDDKIWTGFGWDTVFGGEGCDYVYSYDGGDVIWLGACDPLEHATDDVNTDGEVDVIDAHDLQKVYVYGTGPNGTGPNAEVQYTVIMDFWLEGAAPYNQLCLWASVHQGIPGAGACDQDHTVLD